MKSITMNAIIEVMTELNGTLSFMDYKISDLENAIGGVDSFEFSCTNRRFKNRNSKLNKLGYFISSELIPYDEDDMIAHCRVTYKKVA